MKNDVELQHDVLDELLWEPSVEAQYIGVTVHNGVVTLTGNVPTYNEKFAAESAAKRVIGVHAIAEELTVALHGTHQRNDTDIAQAITTALAWHSAVPSTVKAVVENGWITLSGNVEWHYEREAALDAVRHLTGIVGVTDMVNVQPPVTASTVDVRSAITKALNRNITKKVGEIIIDTKNGKVTLHGEVRSWNEHDQAERAAWSTPGVTAVENDLVIIF